MSTNKITLIDSHIHLDDPAFSLDLADQLQRARNNHIQQWVIPATVASGFQNIHAITQQHSGCHAAFGLHPYFIDQHTEEDLVQLRLALTTFPNVAIGECGLDAMIPDPNMDKQLHFFKAQIKLALEFDLPIIIHARKTVDLVLKEIRKHPTLRGVLHSFSGSMQQAEILINHNFLLGFGGTVTFPRATKLRTILCSTSLKHILIETDAPFQRGIYSNHNVHYPSDLLDIAKHIAMIREDSLERIAENTTENVKSLFKLKD